MTIHIMKIYCIVVQAQEYTRTSQLDAITIPQAPRLGGQVVEVSGLTKSYGDKMLMKDLSFSVPPGSVVGEHSCCNTCLLVRHLFWTFTCVCTSRSVPEHVLVTDRPHTASITQTFNHVHWVCLKAVRDLN